MAEQLTDNTTLELFNGNNMAEIESSKKIGKELQEVLKKEYDEMVYNIESATFPKYAFLHMTDCQKVVNVDVNNVDEFTWWLNISAMSLIEYNKNSNTNVFTPKLKRILLEYCLKTSINEYIKDMPCGKIPLFDGFAYLDVFYLKEVMPNTDEVINGERNFCDIYQYFENKKPGFLRQHEAYPFIEIPTLKDEPLLLLDNLMYEKFYKKVFDGKDEYLDSLKSCNIANLLKLIHESIVKIEAENPTQREWKALLLTYTSKEIMIKTNVITDTVKETNVTEEEKLNITEKLLIFHYLTGYSNNELKDFSIRYGGINVNSISKPLGRIMDFKCNKMSSKQLEQYKPSLEKVKNQLSSQKITEKIQTAINEVDNDIIKCDERIETTKIEEEKAKEEKRKKYKTSVKNKIN